MTPALRAEFPLKLPSVANQHLHWRARAARVKSQRQAVRLALCCHSNAKAFDELAAASTRGQVLSVVLTRIAPVLIRDKFENLPMSLKAVVDQLAEELGVDDSELEISAKQERGPYAVRIEVSALPLAATEVA